MHQPLARMVYPSFLFHTLMVYAQVYGQQTVIFISWTKMVDYFISIVIFRSHVVLVFVLEHKLSSGWKCNDKILHLQSALVQHEKTQLVSFRDVA